MALEVSLAAGRVSGSFADRAPFAVPPVGWSARLGLGEAGQPRRAGECPAGPLAAGRTTTLAVGVVPGRDGVLARITFP